MNIGETYKKGIVTGVILRRVMQYGTNNILNTGVITVSNMYDYVIKTDSVTNELTKKLNPLGLLGIGTLVSIRALKSLEERWFINFAGIIYGYEIRKTQFGELTFYLVETSDIFYRVLTTDVIKELDLQYMSKSLERRYYDIRRNK